ncbi:MAG: DUF87 domain-containing protein, partial [Patescibacteria group bacterium]
MAASAYKRFAFVIGSLGNRKNLMFLHCSRLPVISVSRYNNKMALDLEKIDKDVVYFGRTNFRNQNRLFGIKRKDRRQHMYVVGKTGTGKSAFLHNMVIQDIANGEGICVVDPHGELVESILEKIPEER